ALSPTGRSLCCAFLLSLYTGFIISVNQSQRPLYEVKANLFKGLAHPWRIRILELLSGAEEVSVADLRTDTELEASQLSQHLAVLRRHRRVESGRRASHVYCRPAERRAAGPLAGARGLPRATPAGGEGS